MPSIAWTKDFTGTGRHVLSGSDFILLQVGPEDRWRREGNGSFLDGEEGEPEVHCFALDGQPLWRRSGARLLEMLPGDQVLVAGSGGALMTLGADGHVVTQRECPARFTAARIDGDTLILYDRDQVYLADRQLTIRYQFPRPGERSFANVQWIGGAFYWVDNYQLMILKEHRVAEPIGPSLRVAMQNAVRLFEAQNGDQFVFLDWKTKETTDTAAEFERGKGWMPRPWWQVSHDPARELLFLTNSSFGHFVICMDLEERRVRWCHVLSAECCGGRLHRLPDGRYVTSSGCGRFVSWLDADGNILARSEPTPGEGIYGELHVLANGRCVVCGGPGLIGYGSEMNRTWALNESLFSLAVHSSGTSAAGVSIPRGITEQPVSTVLKVLTGL